MIYCGVDIIEVDRVKNAILKNDNFKYTVFSKNEINEIDRLKNDDVRYQRYAGRFASKEAIYKAISKIVISNNISFNFNEIEVLNDDNYLRRPYINFLKNDLKNIMNGYDFDISISHIKENAIANCVVIKK